MDREIKFRGLQSDGKGWVFGQYISGKSLQKYKHYIIDTNGYHSEVISESVGQFTGLKDKNGKEVYEGDLIKRTITFAGKSREHFEKVIFHEASFCTVSIVDKKDTPLFLSNYLGHQFEITGNIHEPQL